MKEGYFYYFIQRTINYIVIPKIHIIYLLFKFMCIELFMHAILVIIIFKGAMNKKRHKFYFHLDF